MATFAFTRSVDGFSLLGVASGIVHNLSIGLWFGGLMVLGQTVLVGPGDDDVAQAVRGYVRWIRVFVTAAVVSGLLHLYNLDGGAVLSSRHGRLVVFKALGVAAMVYLGAAMRQYIARNVGNIVPPFDASQGYHGTAAAIEYAVPCLNVREIIVCGHSHCGAIRALYEDVPPAARHMAQWLELARDAALPGTSLIDIAQGQAPARTILSEYHAAGAVCGSYMIRHGQYKFIYYIGLPPMLFDLAADPNEKKDLGQDPAYAAVRSECEAALRKVVDPEKADREAKADQQGHGEGRIDDRDPVPARPEVGEWPEEPRAVARGGVEEHVAQVGNSRRRPERQPAAALGTRRFDWNRALGVHVPSMTQVRSRDEIIRIRRCACLANIGRAAADRKAEAA